LNSFDVSFAIIWIALFLLVCGPVHEFSHAFVAWRMGDGTAKLFGRLTLDPVTHFDPVGGGLLILSAVIGAFGRGGVGFGWAKPTPVNPYNLRGKHADSLVAAAGPISNLGLAVLFAIAFRVLHANGYRADNDSVMDLITLVCFVGMELNVVLMLFNLIPVAPLDGSHVLLDFVSPRQAMEIRVFMNQYGIILLVGVVLLAGRIITPVLVPIVNFLAGYQILFA
jgi:Zn-dependent protease